MASQTSNCLRLWNIVFLIFFVNFRIVVGNDDFYGMLGVSRTANNDEIRRAYRRLAREWHPDKNTDSDAQEKFIKINEAYETLSDPKKRDDYDRYGQSGAPKQWQGDNQFFQDSGFMFFNGMPFQFQSNWRHRDFTTFNFFQKTILPESYKKPYLLQIVSDWCMNCAAVEEIWEHTSRELRSLGLGTGRVNRNIDPQLANHLGIRKLPDFVGVIDGKFYHYSGTVTVRNLKEFVSELFPYNLVSEVTNSTLNSFLHRWHDNKPRALLFTSKSEPPLLLKVVSFKYKHNVGIGYVRLGDPANVEMTEMFGAEQFGPTFAIFKENTSEPDVLVKGSELKSGTLDEVISKNLYLNFPRLTSQSMFETLCPQERFPSQRSLCVILFTNDSPDLLRGHPLLSMSKHPTWFSKKVRFAYVSQATQQPFESSIKMTEKTRTICKDKKTSKKVVILWHVKKREVKYSWLNGGWCGPKDAPRLTAMLNQIQSGKAQLELNAVVAELNNEHEKGFIPWLLDVWDDVVYYFFHYLNWSSHTSTLSLMFITFGAVFIISFMLPLASEKDFNSKPDQEQQNPVASDVFGLIELNPETQDDLIHKARQGHLFIVLLSDATSSSQAQRSPIVQMFANISRPYLRQDIFSFGWLSLQDHIAWCNEVMKVQSFGEVKPGTVLALNGAKKYLSIFRVQRRSGREQQDGGNFFEDSEEEEGEVASMVFQEDRQTEKRIAEALGQQLPNWLEKLYEGMLPRVKHQEWPRMECDK